MVNPDGWQDVIDGGTANGTQVYFGHQWISGGTANDTVVVAGWQDVEGNGGLANGTILNADPENEDNRASQEVYNNGIANNTTVNAFTQQDIGDGGVANNTIVNSDGKQHVNFGGTANNTVINQNGQQHIFRGGTTNGTIVNNGSVDINNGGEANDTELNGGRIGVNKGGTANDTTVNSGGIDINGGLADGSILNAGTWQNVNEEGVANNTTINEGGWMGVHAGGTADTVEVLSGGALDINENGIAAGITQHEGGNINAVITGHDTGITIGGQNQNGEELKAEDGIATGFILNREGWQDVIDGGQADGTLLLGGNQYVENGTTNDTLIQEGNQIVVGEDGLANRTVIENGAQTVADGAVADMAIVNNGVQYVENDGVATNTTINSGGWQHIAGGTAVSATIKTGAVQIVSNGGASEDAVLSGGRQMIFAGGEANGTNVSEGYQIVDGGEANDAVITSNGTQIVLAGTADGANISNGGNQNILAGGLAENTVIGNNGLQNVQKDGTANGTTVNAGGLLNLMNGAEANDTEINEHGITNVNTGAKAANTSINNGGLLNLLAGATAENLTVNGDGIASVYGNASFTGNLDLNDNGIIFFARTDSPSTLNIENLTGTEEGSGTFIMNVNLAEKTSDKLIISGTHEGTAAIRIANTGINPTEIKDNELALVEYGDNAEHTGTFTLAGGTYEAGAYEYILSQSSNYNYYLRSTGKATPIFKSISNTPLLNIVSVQAAMNSLDKRLGELRELNGKDYSFGTWARGYYKDMTVKGLTDTDMKISGTEAGFDWNVSDGENTVYLGVMGGYTNISGIKSKMSDKSNSGSGTGFSGGMYMTVANEGGLFVDLTARAMNSEYDITQASSGDVLKYNTKRTMFAGSIETGYSFMKANRTGWKFEPKAEIQYVKTPEKEFDVKNAAGIKQGTLSYNGADYLTGIATLNMSYISLRNNGLKTVPFAEVSYSYELAGEEEFVYAGRPMKTESRKGTFEGRLGVNMQITPAMYFHVAGSYETGNTVKSYGADGGIRIMFGGKKHNTDQEASKPTEQPLQENESKTEKPVPENTAVLPTATNPLPGTHITELNKEKYQKEAEDIKAKGIIDGKMTIPSMGALFKTGSSEILPYYTDMIDTFVSMYKETDGKATIIIDGYSSNGANETKKNPKLSQQRAQRVADYLVSKGISKENIEIVSHSNKALSTGIFSNDKECNGGQCYRRVNVSIKP